MLGCGKKVLGKLVIWKLFELKNGLFCFTEVLFMVYFENSTCKLHQFALK